MNSAIQEQILEVMADILKEQPDMRFGQLVSSLALFAKGPIVSASWDVEDAEFLTAAKRHLENLHGRKEAKLEVRHLTSSVRQKAAA